MLSFNSNIFNINILWVVFFFLHFLCSKLHPINILLLMFYLCGICWIFCLLIKGYQSLNFLQKAWMEHPSLSLISNVSTNYTVSGEMQHLKINDTRLLRVFSEDKMKFGSVFFYTAIMSQTGSSLHYCHWQKKTSQHGLMVWFWTVSQICDKDKKGMH